MCKFRGSGTEGYNGGFIAETGQFADLRNQQWVCNEHGKFEEKSRVLLNGSKIADHDKSFKWEFSSRCPEKFIHIDCEDGNIWQYDSDNEIMTHAKNINVIQSAMIALNKNVVPKDGAIKHALKHENIRLSCADKWMYWDQDSWIVAQRLPRKRDNTILVRTENEIEAIGVLLS